MLGFEGEKGRLDVLSIGDSKCERERKTENVGESRGGFVCLFVCLFAGLRGRWMPRATEAEEHGWMLSERAQHLAICLRTKREHTNTTRGFHVMFGSPKQTHAICSIN